MRTPWFLVLAASFVSLLIATDANTQSVVDKARRDKVFTVPRDDADMEAAFRHAKATLNGFLDLVRSPRSSITGMAVKVAISDGGAREFFWISQITEKDGRLIGKINNTPREVHNVKLGQLISFKPSDVVDWLYRENGKMIGNFTACALISREPPQQAEAFKKQYGLT